MHIFQPSFRLYSLNTHAKKYQRIFLFFSFECQCLRRRILLLLQHHTQAFSRSLVVKSEVNLLPKMEVSKLRTKRVKKGDFVGISCKLFFI